MNKISSIEWLIGYLPKLRNPEHRYTMIKYYVMKFGPIPPEYRPFIIQALQKGERYGKNPKHIQEKMF